MSHAHGISILGAESSGFDWMSLVSKGISATAEGAQRGLDYQQQQERAKVSAAEIDKRAQAAIDADKAASAAVAVALESAAAVADGGQQNAAATDALRVKAAMDKLAAEQAGTVQDAAGIGLPPEASTKRIKAAQDALASVTKDAQIAATLSATLPSDAAKAKAARGAGFKVTAAQMTLNKASSVALTGRPVSPEEQAKADAMVREAASKREGSFLTAKVAGVPAWGIGLGAAGLGAGLYLLVRR